MLLSVVRKQFLEIKENTKRQRWNFCLPLFTLKKDNGLVQGRYLTLRGKEENFKITGISLRVLFGKKELSHYEWASREVRMTRR